MHQLAGPLMGRGPLNEQLDILAHADAIAVVEIIGTRGELVQQGTWIDTILSLRLSQVRATEFLAAKLPSLNYRFQTERWPFGG